MTQSKEKKQMFFQIEPQQVVQIEAGAVDKFNTKSVYMKVMGRYINQSPNRVTELKNLYKKVRWAIERYTPKSIFYDKYIPILEYRDTFERQDSSFVIMDFTLYPKQNYGKEMLTMKLNELAQILQDEIGADKRFDIIRKKE